MSKAKDIPSTQNPHKPPIVEDLLPDIPGGETNLLRASAALTDLKVKFSMWTDSDPTQGTETLELFWDGVSVGSKSWDVPVDPATLFLMVPQTGMGDGEHVIDYTVLIYNGSQLGSEELTITIDTSAPVLNSIDQHLTFPQEVITGGVTADYLARNSDRLLADIPDYNTIKPGDVLTWYWDRSVLSREVAGSKTLSLSDIGLPLTITFEGDMIRQRNDGDRYAYYQIDDRAGNPSDFALPVTLRVDATPIPRDYPWPDIEHAAGVGERVTLVPERVALGATVIVPDFLLPPGEVIWVVWGEPGQLGGERFSMPTPPGSRRYEIPKEYVAPHIGKVFPVSYEIVGPAGTFPSEGREVQLQPLDTSHLPTITCMGVTGGDLSFGSIPPGGAPLALDTWTLMATTQRVRIVMTGITPDSQPIEHLVLDQHPVTDEELTVGLGSRGDVKVPIAFIAQLKRNTSFTLLVYVSFDAGQTWPPAIAPNFPRNSNITLRD